jgi:hypothetical protein
MRKHWVAIVLGVVIVLAALIVLSLPYLHLIEQVRSALDPWASVITAIATAVIAVFTLTLWDSNRRQVKHLREIERAYISGGGPLDANNIDSFLFTVNNYGKTPGVLLEYAVEFCSMTAIPPVPAYEAPDYRRTTFHDRISPGGIKETRVIASIPIPLIDRPMLVYGRYWFEDIWKDLHTSGFVLVIEATGTNPHVPAGIPRAYTDWN